MCEFPSWIKDAKGKDYWLTDKDVNKAIRSGVLDAPNDDPWKNATGHSAIEKVLGVSGKHCEGRRGLPSGFEQDIRLGKCNKMAKVALIETLKNVGDLVPDANKWASEAWEKETNIRAMCDLLKAGGKFDAVPVRVWQDAAISFAERVLPIFERQRPGDDRPRRAIEAAQGYLNGSVTKEQLLLARNSAADAYAATATADAYAAAAAYSAAYSAYSASAAAADAADAASAKERKWQADKLRELCANPFLESTHAE